MAKRNGKSATGTLYRTRDGNVSARLSLNAGVKIAVPLARKHGDASVVAALPVIAAYARLLATRGVLTPRQIMELLTVAASRMSAVDTSIYAQKWQQVASQDTLSKLIPTAHAGATFREIAELWTSGAIHAEHAEVPIVKLAHRDAGMFVKHVFKLIGNVPVTHITKRHFSNVFHELGKKGLRDETRVYIWKLMYRVMQLATDPLELLPANPIPRGKKPAIDDHRRTPTLLPEDDAELLACTSVPIHNRVLYGFLAREGMRMGEALKLQWCDVSAAVLNAFCAKTGKETARMWQHDTHAALVAYRELYWPNAAPADYVFASAQRDADSFRLALKRAGVFTRRPELAMHSRERGERRQIRPHDLRRLFITLAVAQDRADAWIRIRTGHTSSRMIVHYTDLADMHRARGRVTLAAMHVSIPELLSVAARHQETAAE